MPLSHTTLREANILRLPQFKTPEGKPAHVGPECPDCEGDPEIALFLGCDKCKGTGSLPADGTDWSIEGEFNRDRFKIGVGAGVRLLIPGQEMIRFDFGVGESGMIIFQFGTGSKLEAQRLRLR